MISVKYFIKTMIILLVTGVSTAGSLQAVNHQPDSILSSPAELSYTSFAIEQNASNITSEIQSIAEVSVLNLLHMYVAADKDIEAYEIAGILKTGVSQAKSESVRYKSYLALVVINNDEYMHWLTDSTSLNRDDFFSELASLVNRDLLGSYYDSSANSQR